MKKLGIRFRDLLFGGMGIAILYHEVVLVPTAEPLLIFAAFFLLGLIPASRADDGGSFSLKGLLKGWLEEESSSSDKEDKED